MENINTLPIIGVMGSAEEPHEALAAPLGKWIAEHHCHLLTGGGTGVMESVSQAFTRVQARKGRCIGVIPGTFGEKGYVSKPGYPNPYVEIPVKTHLPLSGEMGGNPMSRNHVNILTSDVVVVLPGQEGTLTEAELAVQYRKPVAALLPERGAFPHLPEAIPVYYSLETLTVFIKQHLS